MTVRSAHVDTFVSDRLPPREQWPEFLFELPELRFPDRVNCATRLLDDAVAEGFGQHTALISSSGSVTYSRLLADSNRVARVLRDQMGVVPGNRVLLRAPNNPALFAAWLAVMKVGAVAVTTMPLLRAGELAIIADRAAVDHAICDWRLVDELKAAAAVGGRLRSVTTFGDGALEQAMGEQPAEFTNVDTAADDPCLLAFTSGTTGDPKATVHFHRDMLAVAEVVGRRLLRVQPDDVYVGSPPIGFTFGLGALLILPLRFRAAAVLIEQPSPQALLDAVENHGATCILTAPTQYRSMLPLLPQRQLGALRQCVSAGEPLPRATSDQWFDETGIRIIDGIGSTELTHIFISAAGSDIRSGATGKTLPGYVACVLDERNRPMPPGSSGRLAVKGPTGCRYLDDSRQEEYVIDGWNVTGDRYRIDDDGYFWFEARADDMIVSSGYNIAGPEVEAALLAHSGVRECVVVGVPDAARGHIVKALVVPAAGHTPGSAFAKELQEFVKMRIAPYKYPRAIEFAESLPKTSTGKIQRHVVRERMVARVGSSQG